MLMLLQLTLQLRSSIWGWNHKIVPLELMYFLAYAWCILWIHNKGHHYKYQTYVLLTRKYWGQQLRQQMKTDIIIHSSGRNDCSPKWSLPNAWTWMLLPSPPFLVCDCSLWYSAAMASRGFLTRSIAAPYFGNSLIVKWKITDPIILLGFYNYCNGSRNIYLKV